MKVRKHHSTEFRVLEPIRSDAGGAVEYHPAETTTGRLLIFARRRDAEAVARMLCGKVEEIQTESAERRGRKTDPRVLAAWREWEFAREKPTYRELTEKHFGPFRKTRAGQIERRKKCDSLERRIRKLRKDFASKRLLSKRFLVSPKR